MHFPEKFYRLPLSFDYEKLSAEINAVDESHWSPHPQAFKGNDALILLSNGGTINDLNYGPMEFTPCMDQLPYLKQVLESFNTVIGRTRLMRLAPGEKVGKHSDISLYWWHRFRIHVPIVTHPEVKFYCEDTHVHMQAGEAWTFDNWRYHEVHNNSDITRVHLVIDTVGSPDIWKMLENDSWNPKKGETQTPKEFRSTFIPFVENKTSVFEREQHNIIGVLSPAELDAIADFLIKDLDTTPLNTQQHQHTGNLLQYLKRTWRAFFSAYGRDESYYQDYANILNNVVKELNVINPNPTLKSNGFLLSGVLKAQVSLTIQDVITKQNNAGFKKEFAKKSLPVSENIRNNLKFSQTLNKNFISKNPQHIFESNSSPIFIVGVPSAGGEYVEKLLSNSLSVKILSTQQKLQINQVYVDSYNHQQSDDTYTANLTNEHFQKAFSEFISEPQLANGQIKQVYFDNYLSLRIPSLLKHFPNARFIYVFREPIQNVLELKLGWSSEKFTNTFATQKTNIPWHYPLPNQWQNANLNQLEDRLAFQYSATNQSIMDSLESTENTSVFCLNFQTLIEEQASTITALCDFCHIPFGPKMQVAAQLNIPSPNTEASGQSIDMLKTHPSLAKCYEQIQEWSKTRKS